MPQDEAPALPRDVLDEAALTLAALMAANAPVVTAESCTGGLVAAALTHHAGASRVVEGGFVTYSNTMKSACLGVPPALIEAFGAVSEQVASAMAAGALKAAPDAAIAVSITGIAGPDGGSVAKPVGLVWFGIASRRTGPRSESRRFSGDRTEIRRQAALHALGMVKHEAGLAG